MDDLYTGDSDDNDGNGNHKLSTTNTTILKIVDESQVESKNLIQRFYIYIIYNIFI